MPLYGTKYIFSKKFFTGWVVVFIIWFVLLCFSNYYFPNLGKVELICIILFRGIYWDLTGQTYKLKAWQNEHPEEMHAVRSQYKHNYQELLLLMKLLTVKHLVMDMSPQQTLTMH